MNELKSPSRSPNERSVYYDAVAEHSGGGVGGGGAIKSFTTSGGQGRSLGSFRESKNVESVEARKAADLSGSKATSGTSGGDSSESYNSGGNSGSRQQQHHRHYRHHRSGKAKESSTAAKPAAAASGAPEVERKSLVARRISLDDLSSAFQALVSKKSSSNSSNKSRSSSSASTSAKKQHMAKKGHSSRAAAAGGDNHSDNSGVDERSTGRNGGGGADRYRNRSRSEESLLDTDEKLLVGGMVGNAEGGGVHKMHRSSASPGSGSSPRPPSRTSASRIPLPLRSSASPFNFAAALRGEKEDSVDRYSASSSISDAAGMPMPQPPPYAVATSGTAISDYNPSAHMRPESTTSYLISRYGTAAAAAAGDAASGRYGSYTIYHNPSSHLPHNPHPVEYPAAAAVVGNPGTRASYAGTASGAAKAEYFRGIYPTHYGTSTTVGEDGTMVVGQVDSQVSPRWRRRSYDYENMPGAGPPQTQAAMATVRTTGSGRPLSELASGMARSRSRSRAPAEYDLHGQQQQQHPPPPPPAPPPTSTIYHHHRYGGHPMGYRPASNYMYGHTYAGYHIPMGHSSAAAPSSSAVPVSAADVVAGASTGMGIPGAAGQHMEPHPPPAYSRSDREISARLRRYHQQQPTSHN